MSVIKSFSVGIGDMFYIRHCSDNFTIIDCCLDDYNRDSVLEELSSLQPPTGITRFISTHPDDDHIRGLEYLDNKIGILNFYVVRNGVTKPDQTDSFDRYIELRDHPKKAFYISKGCSRKWMNMSDEERGSSGINILWPDLGNKHFKAALTAAEQGYSPNNISAVIKYSLEGGATALWMGDLETEFMELIEDDLELPPVDILFAAHHGRASGRVPDSLLAKANPKVIVIGEAPSEDLHYYQDFNTITQNSAGDIVCHCVDDKVHIFTSIDYDVDFLTNEWMSLSGYYYLGTLNVGKK